MAIVWLWCTLLSTAVYLIHRQTIVNTITINRPVMFELDSRQFGENLAQFFRYYPLVMPNGDTLKISSFMTTDTLTAEGELGLP